MIDLSPFARTAAAAHGLCVVSTLRADRTIQSSVVNAGVLDADTSPTGAPVVAIVAHAGTHKLTNLRAHRVATVVARAGLSWASVEGTAVLCGPHDDLPGVDAERLRLLLRQIFSAAGGTHDDWDTYDRVLAEEGRTAVLIAPGRAFSDSGVEPDRRGQT